MPVPIETSTPTWNPNDNTPVTPGSGAVLRTDDVAGIKFQVIKLDVGGPGESAQIDGSLPVTIIASPSETTSGSAVPTDIVVIGGSDGTNARALSTDTSGNANVNIANTPTVQGSGNFNVLDQGRVNSSTQLMASAVRTATVSTSTITNSYARGIQLFLNITEAPTSFSETLAITVFAVDPVSGNLFPVTNFTATPAGNSGTFSGTSDSNPAKYTYQLYPGITAPSGLSSVQVQSGVLPFQFQVSVTHSGSNGWTYSLGAMLLS